MKKNSIIVGLLFVAIALVLGIKNSKKIVSIGVHLPCVGTCWGGGADWKVCLT